jgi:hypothetical protein
LLQEGHISSSFEESKMRKIMGILLAAALVWVVFSTGEAQQAQKTVHFKKLQEILPKIDLPGFTKGKPGGETSSVMGMSTSEATLTYEKSGGDDPPTIEVKIADTAGIPFAQMGAQMIGTIEFENENETGYEKSVKVQGFPGTEKVDNSEDGKSAEILLFVGGRFTVELQARGTSEAALLHKLLDSMKLGDLAKLAQ